MRDYFSKTAQLFYLHHFLSVFGALTGICVGRFFATFSNVTMITESTTLFVNLRFLLSFHEMSDTTLYRWNGYTMTASFFVLRCLFMTYVVIFEGFLGANREVDFSKDP